MATTNPETSRRYQVFVVITLSAAMAFSLVDRFALSLLFEPIKADLQLSDTQLGLLHGVAFGLFYATMGIPIAWLIDRWSRKWVMVWGVVCWSAATALCGFSRSFSQLLGARVGVGVGEATLAPAGYSVLADVIPKTRLATAISVFQMGALLGGGLAYLLGGQILSLVGAMDTSSLPIVGGMKPWQLTFIVLAAPGAIFVALLLLIREPMRTGIPAEEAGAVAQFGLLEELRSNWLVYSSLFLGNACIIAVNYGSVTWLPSLLVRQFGWSLPEVGLRFGLVMLIAAPAGVLAGGLLTDYRARRSKASPFTTVLLGSAVACTALTFISFLLETDWALFVCVGFLQFSTALVIGTGPAAVVSLAAGVLRARVTAVYVFAVNLVGLGIGPALVGWLSDNVYDGAVLDALRSFWLGASLIGLSLLLFLHRFLASKVA